MKLGGILRAAARRLRTPAASRAARARPAEPVQRDSPPSQVHAEVPPSDFEGPPLDVALLGTAAYLPSNMVPSSSSGPREPTPLESLCVDKLIVDSPRLSPMCAPVPVLEASGRGALALDAAAASQALAGGDFAFDAIGRSASASVGVDAVPTLDTSSGEEYASGELDSGSDSSGSSWQAGRPSHAEAWVSPGRAELNERLLFAFIEPPVHMLDVSSFIRSALRSVAPLQPVDLLPSSTGAMLLRCESLAARECLHRLAPIHFEGSLLHLQRPEETSNRFFRVPVWLAFVFVLGFPTEHWYAEKIKDCFRGFAEVAEIDPECLSGENFGPLRLLLELNDRLELPLELRIASRSGVGRFGAVAKIVPIRVWPREFQLDSRGNLSPFFGPPAPPSAGPSLGPPGPMSTTQQSRQSPHFYNLAFPPNANHGHGSSNLQRSFDPLGLDSSALSGVVQDAAWTIQRLVFALALAWALHTCSAAVRRNARAQTEPQVSYAGGTPPAPASLECLSSQRGSSGERVKPLITYQRRRLRSKGSRPATKAAPARRTSSRLAAKAPAGFVDMTTQAMQRKALINSLSTCSLSLKRLVSKRNILSRNKLPIGARDLRLLAAAAGLQSNAEVNGLSE